MVQQFVVICQTYSVSVWPLHLTDIAELVTVDCQYNVDGEPHQYAYMKGQNAEVGKNWRERCAIEAHYHAHNAGGYVQPVQIDQRITKRNGKIAPNQMVLPFDDVSGQGE